MRDFNEPFFCLSFTMVLGIIAFLVSLFLKDRARMLFRLIALILLILSAIYFVQGVQYETKFGEKMQHGL